MSELASWKSHKVVKAGKIRTINFPGKLDAKDFVLQVDDKEGRQTEIKVPPEIFARGVPEPGCYLVIYDDGYHSWSPARAFEDGYTRLTT